MKGLNVFVLALAFATAYSRISDARYNFPKQSRYLADNENLKIAKNVQTRAAKKTKTENRKLLTGTQFGVASGLLGLGLMKLGRGKQEQEIKTLKTNLEIQRMMLGNKEAQRTAVLNEINRHVDETFEKFGEYRSALIGKIDEFNTFIQSKLKAYGIATTKNIGIKLGGGV